MSVLGKNLKTLRKLKGITQQQLANAIEVKRSLIGSYEEGRAEPNIEKLKGFAQYFGISVDTLISPDLEQGLSEIQLYKKDQEGKNLRILSVTTGKEEGEEEIQLVSQKAAAGYLNGYADPEYVSELPEIKLPGLTAGTFRAFEISGDSMLPIEPGSVIVARYVDNWKEIKEGKTYILVLAEEGIVYKRIKDQVNKNGSLLLISDNPSYAPYEVKIDEVLEIWEARAFFSTNFPAPEMDFGRLGSLVANLQKEISELKRRK